ncbi:hypothetical protein ACFQ0O_15920 [Saccharopolyspora spinosporotrichia]
MRRLDVVLTARRLWAAGYLAVVFLVVVGGLGAPFGWDGKAVIALSFVAAGIAAAGHFPSSGGSRRGCTGRSPPRR